MATLPASPFEAVHQLAASVLVGELNSSEERCRTLAALEVLREAPLLDHWNRGLLGGLRSRDPQIVEATVKATVQRLAHCSEPEPQDALITAILDACFLNLSGRPRLRGGDEEALRAEAFERAASRLVEELTRLLAGRPLELEHHRARLLARARSIAHLAGRGHLAEAVVRFQLTLADGARSDQLAARELYDLRKTDLYTSALASEDALLAYLAEDRRITVEQVSQELFQVYRMLIAGQSKERARRALLQAMANLMYWLDQLPQNPQDRFDLREEALRARARVPWGELDLRLCRHLEAHLELLPGCHHPEDLLVLLEQRYDAAESEDLLIRGLELLRRLPLVRVRSAEICAFILRHGRRGRSAAVWKAFLGLIEALLTGLADFVLTREALGEREQRRNRALRKLLVHDDAFRELLRRLATDSKLEISRDDVVAREVREQAWRILLRSLPQNRLELLEEGLMEHGGRLFTATVEEASTSHQRELWGVVLGRWQELVEDGQPVEERRRRIAGLAQAFRATANFEAVQDKGEDPGDASRLGPMIRLALDDPDEEVRRETERAVVETGYALELERERQRRELLRLRAELTHTNQQIIELEAAIALLVRTTTETQVERAEQALAVQAGLQDRDLIVTEGWLATASFQVDLEEVRIELIAALTGAQEQLELLHALRRRMEQEHHTAQAIHTAIASLVHQQEQHKAEIAQLEGQQQRAQNQLAAAESELEARRSERGSLSRPSRPRGTGDDEQDRRAAEDYQNAVQSYEREVQWLGNRIAALAGEVESCRAAISAAKNGIKQARAVIERLSAQIAEQSARISAIRRRLHALEGEFLARKATCEQIRNQIRLLQGQVQRLESDAQGERQRNRALVANNSAQVGAIQSRLDDLQATLQQLSSRLNHTGAELDRQRTRGQRLIQSIDAGRQNYERVAEQADQRSAEADASGISRQRASEQKILEGQESLVHYVEGLDRALRHQPPPPTRDQRRRDRKPRAPRKIS